MNRRSLIAVVSLVATTGQALTLLEACASDGSTATPQETSDVADAAGNDSEPDSDTSLDAGPCVDCEYFPEACSPDALCLNGPFDPGTPQGGIDTFDLRTTINVIVGRGTSDVWAAGTVGALAHFDGTSWRRSGPDTMESLQGLWLFDEGELAFGAKMNRVFLHGIDLPDAATNHPSDDGWTSTQMISVPPEYYIWDYYTFRSAWASAGARWAWGGLTNIFSTSQGMTGLWRLRRLPDATFELQPAAYCTDVSPCTSDTIASIHGSSTNVLWAVGSQGSAFRIDGADGDSPRVEAINSATWHQLNGVWAASESEAWAVGATGTIRHYTAGSSIADIVPEIPLSANFRAVWGTSPSDIWAVGDAGLVLHYDGTSWSRVKIAGLGARRPDLTAVWTPSPGHVWIGGQGVILSLGGRP